MFHVLEHLYEPHAYMEAAHELLRPDGRLVIQVPNAASWQFLLLGENWSGLDVPRHLLTFRASDLEVLLDRCGFEAVRYKYFSLRDNPAGLATSLAPWLDPMARRVRGVRGRPAGQAAQGPAVLLPGGGLGAAHAARGRLPRGVHGNGGGAQENVKPRFPRWLAGTALGRYVLHFEAAIERAVADFAAGLPAGSRVLDAGAGEASVRALLRPAALHRGGPGRRRRSLGLRPARRPSPT